MSHRIYCFTIDYVLNTRMAMSAHYQHIGFFFFYKFYDFSSPVAETYFSFCFKSNARNYELLRKFSATPRRSTASDWAFVIFVLAALLVILAVSLALSFWLLYGLAKLLGLGSAQP